MPLEVRSIGGLGGFYLLQRKRMDWIPIEKRVPDNRRKVLAWGRHGLLGMTLGDGVFLGVTQFNASKAGGNFDADYSSITTWCSVTHWCEIEGPAGEN